MIETLYISKTPYGVAIFSDVLGENFKRFYIGYSERKAIAEYMHEIRTRMNVKRLPFKFKEVRI